MKKIPLTLAIIFIGLCVAFAQSSTTLTIRLYPIQTIEIKPLQEIDNLDFEILPEAISNNLNKSSSLSIQSTGGFMIRVKSNTIEESKGAKGDDISASDIHITPSKGHNPLMGTKFASAYLSTEPTPIISHHRGGINNTFNISYNTIGPDNYNGYESLTSIVYSIEAK